MVKISKGNFIELEYTGRIKLGLKVFDTSNEEIAKSNKIYNSNMNYGPVVVCIGENNVIKGLDQKLEGREIGKEYDIELEADEGFGKKNPKLMKTVSTALFKKQNMNPYPGLQINAEGMIGTVRSVNGGRVMLDFNHPLAGRELVYSIKVLSLVEDIKKQVDSLVHFNLFMEKEGFDSEINEDTLKLTTKIKVPDVYQKIFEGKVKNLIPAIKKIEFLEDKTK